MLTLREPIRLKSARGLSTLSGRGLGALAGNYNITQSTLNPSDLLLLFSPHTEFPEEMGGTTAISIRQSSTDVRNITMSVVNNLLNTIAVNQHNEFTYQDRVHITSMLRQLGIENVQQFMQQVQLLRQEHQSVAELLTLYHNETVQHFAGSRATSETHDHHESRHSTTQQVTADGRPYYLHNEIYHRLQTGDIYQELHAHQTTPSMANTFVNNQQLRLSEQLRVSTHLQLNELRSQVVSSSQMTLYHHQNSYETGELLPVPTTEREVLQHAFTATLLSTVDNLLTQRFDATYATTNSWTDVAEQLEQTAYNTLSRFESYHSGQSFTYNEGAAYTQSRLAVYNTEAQLLQQLISEQQQLVTAEPGVAPHLTNATPAYLEYRTAGQEPPAEVDGSQLSTETQVTTEQVTNRITELTRQLLEGTPPTAVPPARTPTMLEPLRELLQSETPRQQADERQAQPRRVSDWPETQLQETTTNITQPVTEQIYSQLTKVLLQQPTQPPTVADAQEPPAGLLLSQLPAPEQEIDPELLVQQLDAIDRKNREMLIRLQERTEVLRREVAPPLPADPAKTRVDALRALNEPEKLLAELRERPEIPMQHNLAPAVEAALELTSPEVRYILEKATQYVNNPQTLQEGMHMASPVELHRSVQEVLQANRTVEQVERELLQTTTRVEQQAAQQVLQEWTQAAVTQQRTNRPQEVQPLPIVHKSERRVVDEELLELLEQQKTNRTEVVKEQLEQVNVNTVRETNTTNLSQQIVTQSSEEITELVNRALTRQMGTISEKVYSQMERKLQLERSRRGRF